MNVFLRCSVLGKIKKVALYLKMCLLGYGVFSASAALAQVSNASENAYAEAMKLMRNKNYAEAARIFYLLMTQAEGTTKLKAEFGVAEALRALNLHHSAAYFYMRIAAQGPTHTFFRNALENIATINDKVPLGRANITSLFAAGPDGKMRIEPIHVPPGARGFYFYYKGLDSFEKGAENKAVEGAKGEFLRVPKGTSYYPKAQYYVGVISTLTGDLDGALRAFKTVLDSSKPDTAFRELAILALARVHYERKDVRQAFQYYSMIPRNSDNWLQALFEGAWTYFLIQKNNNTLGNIHTIHSPFFRERFFPETYILQAITFLKLCHFDKVDKALKDFQNRYRPTFAALNALLQRYRSEPAAFYSLVQQYRRGGGLREYQAAAEVIDSISRSDTFKEAKAVIEGISREETTIVRSYAKNWANVGLLDVLRTSFENRKAATMQRAGYDLFLQAVESFKYLRNLSDQTKLIVLERATSDTDAILKQLANQEYQVDNNEWGEGMKPLDLTKELEYWPFEGEWWEDELGGYVYNIGSKCNQVGKPADKTKK